MVPYFKIRKLQRNMQCSTFFLTNGFRVNTTELFADFWDFHIFNLGLQLRSSTSVLAIEKSTVLVCAICVQNSTYNIFICFYFHSFWQQLASVWHNQVIFTFLSHIFTIWPNIPLNKTNYFINKLTYPIKRMTFLNNNSI